MILILKSQLPKSRSMYHLHHRPLSFSCRIAAEGKPADPKFMKGGSFLSSQFLKDFPNFDCGHHDGWIFVLKIQLLTLSDERSSAARVQSIAWIRQCIISWTNMYSANSILACRFLL